MAHKPNDPVWREACEEALVRLAGRIGAPCYVTSESAKRYAQGWHGASETWHGYAPVMFGGTRPHGPVGTLYIDNPRIGPVRPGGNWTICRKLEGDGVEIPFAFNAKFTLCELYHALVFAVGVLDETLDKIGVSV
jgi:hypothetical protein